MNDEDPTPVMYEHCEKVFAAMRATAVVVNSDEGKMMVWEGFLTRLIQGDLNMAVPYYSTIRGHLTRMGCIRQLRRGGGNSMSQWEVIKPPTLELFGTATTKGSLARQVKDAQAQQIHDLAARVSVLERDFGTLMHLINTSGALNAAEKAHTAKFGDGDGDDEPEVEVKAS